MAKEKFADIFYNKNKQWVEGNLEMTPDEINNLCEKYPCLCEMSYDRIRDDKMIKLVAFLNLLPFLIMSSISLFISIQNNDFAISFAAFNS